MSAKAYKMKVIISGGVYEFYKYEDTVFRGYKSRRSPRTSHIFYSEDGTAMVVDRETGELIPKEVHSRARSNIRAKNTIRRLALTNFNKRSKFLTLTFKDNVQDLNYAKDCLDKFIRALRKEQDDLKYLTVMDFQERGAIHFHMLCDLKYVRVEKLRSCWLNIVGEGNIDLKRINHVQNIGLYMVKHMTKDNAHLLPKGKNSYYASRNLEHPKELIGAQAEYLYERMQIEERKMAYSSSYENKQTTNKITCEEYYLFQRLHSLLPTMNV